MMKARDLIWLGLGIASVIVAVERFYKHPTYGRGIKAALAAANLATLL